MPVEERAGDRAHEQTRREREERDRARETRRVESLECEQDEDELDHRRRRPRKQHAADEAWKTRDLEELPIARRRLSRGRYVFRSD